MKFMLGRTLILARAFTCSSLTIRTVCGDRKLYSIVSITLDKFKVIVMGGCDELRTIV